MNANLVITAAGVAVALFIGGMQVWIALQQQQTADRQAALACVQGELQTQQGQLQTISGWLPFLTDGNTNVRLSAVLALDRIEGDAAVPPLIVALSDGAGEVRDRAAGALVRRVTEANVDTIVDLIATSFENQEPGMRQAALDALVNIGGPSIERLEAALRKPLAADTRREAAQAIGRILLNEQVMKKIGVLEAHEITTGSPEIVVALVGGGVDRTAPGVDRALIEEVDHAGEGGAAAPSTAFAARLIVGHPESDVVGVAPNVRLLSEKVLRSTGAGDYATIARGIDHATQAGAHVVYLELGGPATNDVLAAAIERAHAAGALLVAAGGNDNSDKKTYPAALERVLAVAATDGNDRRAPYSSYGDWIDIAAPGAPTLGQEQAAGELALRGTSFSGSLVAGAAALVWSVAPTASADEVRAALLETADDLDEANPDFAGQLGSGRVNVLAAVRRMAAELVPSQ